MAFRISFIFYCGHRRNLRTEREACIPSAIFKVKLSKENSQRRKASHRYESVPLFAKMLSVPDAKSQDFFFKLERYLPIWRKMLFLKKKLFSKVLQTF